MDSYIPDNKISIISYIFHQISLKNSKIISAHSFTSGAWSLEGDMAI